MGNFEGKQGLDQDMPAAQTCPVIDMHKVTQQRAAPV